MACRRPVCSTPHLQQTVQYVRACLTDSSAVGPFYFLSPVAASTDFPTIFSGPKVAPTMPCRDLWDPHKSPQESWIPAPEHITETPLSFCTSLSRPLSSYDSPRSSLSHFMRGTEEKEAPIPQKRQEGEKHGGQERVSVIDWRQRGEISHQTQTQLAMTPCTLVNGHFLFIYR